MQPGHAELGAAGIAWRLGATLFFVLLNGFFVATEFALVKVRASRIDELAASGSKAARGVQHILRHINRYLSACQLGITLASLILGALGEPAVSVLILAAAAGVGLHVSPEAAWLPVVSIGLAFALITLLHMTLGEQAPKMWALRQAESTALHTSWTLRAFTFVFRPFIFVVNAVSNAILRLAGLPPGDHHEVHSAEEIRGILSIAARAGQISDREHQITENVFRMVSLEVRHILVPRVEVEYLSLRRGHAQNLARIRASGHSRLPLCEEDLDSVIGVVHTRDALEQAIKGGQDLRAVAREMPLVPDTMSLSDFLLDLQTRLEHCAVVVDEHGTAVGMAFREDVLEEIVGPLGDEFDRRQVQFREVENGVWEISGRMSLPEVCARLGLELSEVENEAEDTLGGHLTARLGRLARKGDVVRIGDFEAVVMDASRRRVQRLRLRRLPADASPPDGGAPPSGAV